MPEELGRERTGGHPRDGRTPHASEPAAAFRIESDGEDEEPCRAIPGAWRQQSCPSS